MKTKYNPKSIWLLFALIFFTSCNQETQAPNDLFVGHDMEGKEQTCSPMPEDMACTMMMAPSDFFGMKCKELGHKAFQCGCHYWLCEKPIKFEEGN